MQDVPLEDGGADFGGGDMTMMAGGSKAVKSVNSKTAQMTEALEQMAAENDRSMPLFKRGPEVELASQQEVEMLKQALAQIKVHIPTDALEKGIIMPRDNEGQHPGYPTILEGLTENPCPKVKETNKRKKPVKKKEDKKSLVVGSQKTQITWEGTMKDGSQPIKIDWTAKADHKSQPLVPSKPNLKNPFDGAFRPCEYGNLPIRYNDGKPKCGVWRLMLPADADWSDPKAEKETAKNEQGLTVNEGAKKKKGKK